jgi:acetyl-CoA synthetase
MFEQHGVSIGLFPPTVLRMLRRGEASRQGRPRLRLRCLVTGAEAVEPELLTWALDALGAVVNNAFGQTEANALVGHSSALGALDPTCLGRPYPGHEIAVVDEHLDPVAPGVLGELAVRATDPVCLLGYWDAPDATAAKVRGGWLLTGDTVHRDDRGQLHFHGRADDLIKSGGYRIGPAEVEAALLLDDTVLECAVVGMPDPVRGQAVTAFVRLRAGAIGDDALAARLRDLVRTRAGAHAYPRDIRYVDELPLTSTGKIDRAALRRGREEARSA